MTQPTQAQIEAAAHALYAQDDLERWEALPEEGKLAWRLDAKAALTAAAQVGESQPQYRGDKDSGFLDYPDLDDATIERCAQVAEEHWIPGSQDIAAAIRKLKDEHAPTA